MRAMTRPHTVIKTAAGPCNSQTMIRTITAIRRGLTTQVCLFVVSVASFANFNIFASASMSGFF
jgi:hypothetical protein